MIKKGFVKNIEVKYSEMDCNLALKPSALLNYLQDFASENAEKLGFGYSYVTGHNLMWFLLKYRMEFKDYPVGVYNLTVKTNPRGYNKLFALRDFEIWNNDRCLGRAASTWGLADINDKSLAQIEKVLQSSYMPSFKKEDDDLQYEKIKIPEKFDTEKLFDVRYNDIDVNSHANNGNYIIWAFEPLSYEFKNTHKPETLDMIFKKELKYGGKVLSQTAFEDENTTVHILKNAETDMEVCLLKCRWRKI